MRRLLGLTALTTLALVALAVAAQPKNGAFENGLSGWKTALNGQEGSSWTTYKKGDVLGGDVVPKRGGGPPPQQFYNPPQGKYAAYAPGVGGARFMSRKLTLRSGRKITLSMKVFFKNFANDFYTPKTFDTETPAKNQQYRIDVIRADAPIDSLKKSDVLKTVFRTKHGDQRKRKPFTVSKSLTKLAGKTVRLRFAEADNQYYFYAGVDDVSLTQKR